MADYDDRPLTDDEKQRLRAFVADGCHWDYPDYSPDYEPDDDCGAEGWDNDCVEWV